MSANALYCILRCLEVCIVLVCYNTDNMGLPYTVSSTTAGFREYPFQPQMLPSARRVIHLCQVCSNKDSLVFFANSLVTVINKRMKTLSGLTLGRSYLKPYCKGRKTTFYSAGI
jgi:hypothetical protein